METGREDEQRRRIEALEERLSRLSAAGCGREPRCPGPPAQIVLSVPDGRSVKTLVNATPIHGPDGEVESLVVTLQDLSPLEELERQRADFLSMVSHELRAPLISIKGSTATVLGSSPGPNRAELMQFFRVIDEHADHMRGLIADLLDQGRIEAGTLSVSPEPAALAGLVEQARSTFLSGGGRHALRIDLPADRPRVMADAERIVQVLNNLFSNAARHSPESSPISVAAVRVFSVPSSHAASGHAHRGNRTLHKRDRRPARGCQCPVRPPRPARRAVGRGYPAGCARPDSEPPRRPR